MLLQLEHDGAIDIPAGAAAFTVADHLKIPVDTQLLAIYPHAHYLGKRIEAWADLPGGERRPLLRIDDWDINWQATYTYKEPIRLPAGTTVRMRITYDNTAANRRNPSHPPQRVKSGNRSEDEMGHVWLQVLPERRGEEDPRLALQQALMERRIEKYPADFVAHFNLGAALQSMGKHEQALVYLARAVRIRPDNAQRAQQSRGLAAGRGHGSTRRSGSFANRSASTPNTETRATIWRARWTLRAIP